MFDVITVGGATVDNFLDTNIHEHVINRAREICYPLGAKIRINNVETFSGGGGTNTAVAFSRLGFKTGYMGKVGNDSNGRLILDELRKEKVKFLGAISKKEKTDFSIILDAKGHDRTILNYKDASSKLQYNEVRNKLNARWLYFSSLLGDSFVTLKKIARQVDGRVNIGFNASSYLVEDGVGKIRDILRATSVFVLNKEEAEMLVGKADVEKMLVRINKAGPGIVCITDGSRGSWTYDSSYVYHQKAHKIKVVEKTGAGDAYAATLIAGIMRKKSIEQSLSMAAANAESVIRHKGAKNILLSWNKVNGKSSEISKKRL